MSNILHSAKENFLTQLDSVIERMNGQRRHPAHALKLKAREALSRNSFPDRKDEDWKYTSVRPVVTQSYQWSPKSVQPPAIPELEGVDAYRLVFVNGLFKGDLSDELPRDIFFDTLNQAWTDKNHSKVAERVVDHIDTDGLTVFEAISIGMSAHAMLLSVPANYTLDKPIRIVHLTSGSGEPVISHPFLITDAGKGSQCEIIEQFAGSTSDAFINPVHRVFVDQNAIFRIYRMQEESREDYHISHTTVTQARDSTFGMFAAELGGRLVRNNIKVTHAGTNVKTNLYGVVLAGEKQHVDTQSFIDHAIPHCESNELYKSILSSNGRGVFNGKIIVRQDAQKTNAFQQNSTLVLSPLAVMDSKPQLEIFADDVRCSHGATIGQLDEDSVFYLMTRGLDRKQASRLLQKAFVGEVLKYFPSREIADAFTAMIDEKLVSQHEHNRLK